MGVILCEFESRPPHPSRKEEISNEVSSFSLYTVCMRTCIFRAQRKIGLNGKSRLFCNLLLPAQSRRSKPLGLACAACFEQLACVFASCGALHYAKILASLKIKNGISLTPLNCDLNAFTFALKDSADAFVERLSK